MAQSSEQNTYPVSRFLSDPLGRGALSGAMTSGNLAALRALGKSGKIPGLRPELLNIKNKHILLAGLGSGVATGLFTSLARKSYPSTIQAKLRDGGDLTDQEKRLILKGINVKPRSKPKSLQDHMFSPASMSLLGAGLYGTVLTKKPGLKPAALGAASLGLGAILDRYVMARGLAGRGVTGKGMSGEEERLMSKLKSVREKHASLNPNYERAADA
jgi:hypothetical protein